MKSFQLFESRDGLFQFCLCGRFQTGISGSEVLAVATAEALHECGDAAPIIDVANVPADRVEDDLKLMRGLLVADGLALQIDVIVSRSQVVLGRCTQHIQKQSGMVNSG